jgi:transposase
MYDIELYGKILNITAPWVVTDVKLDIAKQTVTVTVEYSKKEPMVCPVCLGHAKKYDHVLRSWRHLDTCQMKTIIECYVPRVNCDEHGIKQLEVMWAEKNSRFTALFEALVINWLKYSNTKGVATRFGLSWDQVDGIKSRAVKRGLKRRQLKSIKHLSIDETSFKKGHDYVTVLIDQDQKTVVDVLEDRKAETLSAWLARKPKHHLNKLETISMDMWDAYIRAVKDHVPQAEEKICFDKYHVSSYFSKAVDKVRAEEHRKLLKQHKKSPLTGTRFDWLRNAHKLDNRTRREFMQLCKKSLKTSRAWAYKETASCLWDYQYTSSAIKSWSLLIRNMLRSRLEPIKKVAKTVKNYLWGIINAIIAKVTNAISETKNAGIQLIKRMAHGFRNKQRFRDAILFHFGGLDMMPAQLNLLKPYHSVP